MKLVIEHYGKFMLEGIVIFAVCGILVCGLTDENGNHGIFAVMGEQLEVSNENYLAYTDFADTYKAESEKTPPKISWHAGRIETGVHVLSDYIKVTDYAGNALAFQVMEIEAPDGTKGLSSYNPDTTEIGLSQMGVYKVTLFAKDDGKRITRSVVQIPVNSK